MDEKEISKVIEQEYDEALEDAEGHDLIFRDWVDFASTKIVQLFEREMAEREGQWLQLLLWLHDETNLMSLPSEIQFAAIRWDDIVEYIEQIGYTLTFEDKLERKQPEFANPTESAE